MTTPGRFPPTFVAMLLATAETEETLLATVHEASLGLWMARQARDALTLLSPAELQAGEAFRVSAPKQVLTSTPGGPGDLSVPE